MRREKRKENAEAARAQSGLGPAPNKSNKEDSVLSAAFKKYKVKPWDKPKKVRCGCEVLLLVMMMMTKYSGGQRLGFLFSSIS